MNAYFKLFGISVSVVLLQSVVAQAEQPKTNDALGALQGKAAEIRAKVATFSKTDNYQLLMDAAEIADHLYPEQWPREMTGEAEQMLRLRIEVIKAIDSAIDRAFDPGAPENRAFINVAPPVTPTNPPGPTASGMDPAGIADPMARKAYEEAIAKNSKKIAKINREHSLERAFDSSVNSTWVFLLNLRKDSLAYRRGIQIVEETVTDTNVVRKLKRKRIGSPD
jgi:hypothetical protein